VKVNFQARGKLVVSAILGLDNRGAPGTHATVTAEVIVDRRAVTERSVIVDGGQLVQVPIQEALTVGPGTHIVGVAYEARYSARGPDVFVGPTSIVALALPAQGN